MKKRKPSKPGQTINGRKLISSEYKNGRTWWKHRCKKCGGNELEHEANRIKVKKSWPHECSTQQSGECHQPLVSSNTNYIKNCQVCNAGLTEIVNEVLEDNPKLTPSAACKKLFNIAIEKLEEDDLPKNFTPENLRNRYRYHTNQIQRESTNDGQQVNFTQKVERLLKNLNRFYFKASYDERAVMLNHVKDLIVNMEHKSNRGWENNKAGAEQ